MRTPPTHEDERDAGLRRHEQPGDRGCDGEAVGDQRRRVVQQALALEDRDDPLRGSDAPEDRGRRDRIGRGDDGTQGEGGKEAHLGHEEPKDQPAHDQQDRVRHADTAGEIGQGDDDDEETEHQLDRAELHQAAPGSSPPPGASAGTLATTGRG